MKKIILSSFLVLLSLYSFSQCPLGTYVPISGGDVTPPPIGTSTVTGPTAGDYIGVNVLAGNIYTFTTCNGNTYDTELTLYDNVSTFIDYNDDDCGSQSTIVWTATYTGVVYLQINEYNFPFDCQTNSTSTTIEITSSPPVQTGNGCSTDITICTPGVAGPFGFSTPGNPVSSCLDFFGPDYAYIVLYVTQSGPLEMLIDGDATSGFLDVAVFNIPPGDDPCTAIEDVNNEISCNYAAGSDGCNQIGTAFPCPSSVPSPNVNAGDVLFIVVENWSGTSTNFTLELAAPPAAQTGPPDPTINEVTLCDTAGLTQITAVNMGGTWSGSGISPTGMFDPSVGPGVYPINYDIGSAPCAATATGNITVVPCVNPCNMDSILLSQGFCINNQFSVSTDVYFTGAPTTGTLTITINDGTTNYDTIINAPFTSPTSWVTNIPTGGGAYTVDATFSADLGCTIGIGGTAPPNCDCSADIGTFTLDVDGNGATENIQLCFGETFTMTSNGDMVPAAEALAPDIQTGTGDPMSSYSPGIGYIIYSCPPTVFPQNDIWDPMTGNPNDPCVLGVVGFGNSYSETNVAGGPIWAGPFVDNTVYYVPVTVYDTGQGYISYTNTTTGCYSMGNPIAVQYLPEVLSSNPIENCQDSSFTITITGGAPEVDGSNYVVSNLMPANAFFIDSIASHNGTLQIGGLLNGDMYSFDVADSNGCPITVSGGPFVGLPLANAGVDDTSCTLNYVLNATLSLGTSTGSWSGQPGVNFAPANSASATATATSSGTYDLYWTENNTGGCIDIDTVTITFLDPITNVVVETCADSTFTVTLSDGLPEQDGSNYIVSNLMPATAYFVDSIASHGEDIIVGGMLNGDMYSFDVIDNNGCTVTINGGPYIAIPNANAGVDDTTCTLTYNLNATPSVGTGTWTGQAGVSFSSNLPNAVATATAAGVYELYWTEDNSNGCTDVDTVVISFSNLSYTTTLSQPTCGNFDGTITVNATGGLTPYIYSNDSALTFQALDSFPNLAQGNYDVFVVDALGCIQSSTEVLIDSNSPTIDSLSLTDPLCNGDANGQVVVHATGGVTPYQFSIDAGALQADSTFTGLSGAVSYLFTVQDNLGCTDTMSTTLINPTLLVLDSAIATDVICNGDNDGTISIYAQGGTGTLSYSIDSGATFVATSVFNGLTPKTYGVVVQDANNCQQTIDVVVNQPLAISIPNLVDSVVCFGTATGQIQVLPQGGISPYTYSWSPSGGAGTIASNLLAGTYTVTVTDANLCQQDSTFDVFEPAQFVYTTDAQNANCNQPDGWAAVTSFAGGTGNYTFLWDVAAGNQVTDTAFNLVPGNYDVTITDGNLCDTTIQITVGNNPSFTTSITNVVNVKCKDGNDGAATANGSDLTATYSYSWSTTPVQNTQTVTGLSANIMYYVTITDVATGCFEMDSVMVTEPDSVTITATGTQTICVGQFANLSATAVGGNGGYTYTWDNGLGDGQNQSVSPAPGSVTNYSVYATDDSSCVSAPTTVTVTVYQALSVVASPNDTICTYESAQLSATPSFGNGGPYSYSWSPSAGLNNSSIQNPIANPTQATMYYVTLSDGCSPDVVDSVYVGEWALPQPSATSTPNVCVDNGLITFTNTSNTSIIDTNTVTWFFGDGSYQNTPWDTVDHQYNNVGLFPVSMAVSTLPSLGSCRDTLVVIPNVEIYALPIPDFFSEPNPTTMFDTGVEFDGSPTIGFPASWHWDFAGLDSSVFPNPIYNFPDDTVGAYPVTLTVTDVNGCVSSITKIVQVDGEFGLFVPNTFTPDFDNKNDIFRAKGFGISDRGFVMQIYDRWGEKIFEGHHIDEGWDGFYKGTRVKTDTYVWKIVFNDINGEKHVKHGHVNIIQ